MARIPTSDLPTVAAQGASYRPQGTDRSVIQGIEKLGKGALQVVDEINKRKVATEVQNSKYEYEKEKAEIYKAMDVAIADNDATSFTNAVSDLSVIDEKNKEIFDSYGAPGRDAYTRLATDSARQKARRQARFEIAGLQKKNSNLKMNLAQARQGIITGNAFSKDNLEDYFAQIDESGLEDDDKKSMSQDALFKFSNGLVNSVSKKGWNKGFQESASLLSGKIKDKNLKQAFEKRIGEARVEYKASLEKKSNEAPTKASKLGSMENGESSMQSLALSLVDIGASDTAITNSYGSFYAKSVIQAPEVMKGNVSVSNYIDSKAMLGNPDREKIKNQVETAIMTFKNSPNKAQALVDSSDQLNKAAKVLPAGQSSELISDAQIERGVPKTRINYYTKDMITKAGSDWATQTATITDGGQLRAALTQFIPQTNAKSMYALADITAAKKTGENKFPQEAMAAYFLGDGGVSESVLASGKGLKEAIRVSGVNKKELFEEVRKEVSKKIPAAPMGHPNNALRESFVAAVAANSIEDKNISVDTSVMDEIEIYSGANNSSIILREKQSMERKAKISALVNDPVNALVQLQRSGRGLDIIAYMGKMPGNLLAEGEMQSKTALQKKATLAKNAFERGDLERAYTHFSELVGDQLAFANAYNSGDSATSAPMDIGLFINGIGAPLQDGSTLSLQDIDLILNRDMEIEKDVNIGSKF
jgi:hypothetical protein